MVLAEEKGMGRTYRQLCYLASELVNNLSNLITTVQCSK